MDDAALTEALDALEHVLAEQACALYGGDADALPALGRQVQDRLAHLVRTATRQPLPARLRPRVASLLQHERASEIALLRRQQDIEGALSALGAANPALQELQSRRVYGASGALGAPAWGSRGFERV